MLYRSVQHGGRPIKPPGSTPTVGSGICMRRAAASSDLGSESRPAGSHPERPSRNRPHPVVQCRLSRPGQQTCKCWDVEADPAVGDAPDIVGILQRTTLLMYEVGIGQDPVKARVALPAADPPDHAIDGDCVTDSRGGRPAVLRLPHGFADASRAGTMKVPIQHELRTSPERMGSEHGHA